MGLNNRSLHNESKDKFSTYNLTKSLHEPTPPDRVGGKTNMIFYSLLYT